MKAIMAALASNGALFDSEKIKELQEVSKCFFRRFFDSYLNTLSSEIYGAEDGSVWLTMICRRFRRNVTFKISDSFHGNIVEINVLQDDFNEHSVFGSSDYGDIARFSDGVIRRLSIECKKDRRGSKGHSTRKYRKGA